jgi:hypothetical protein
MLYQRFTKIITDYQIEEEFGKYPPKIEQFYIDGNRTKGIWRKEIHRVITEIFHEFVMRSSSEKNCFTLIKILEKHWKKVDINWFASTIDYCITTAKVTDYLLKYLMKYEKIKTQRLLVDKYIVGIRELEINFELIIDEIEGNRDSIIIRKFIIGGNAAFEPIKNMIILFCHEVFQKLPQKIELYSLLTGKCMKYYPTYEDYQTSIIEFENMLSRKV